MTGAGRYVRLRRLGDRRSDFFDPAWPNATSGADSETLVQLGIASLSCASISAFRMNGTSVGYLRASSGSSTRAIVRRMIVRFEGHFSPSNSRRTKVGSRPESWARWY